MPGPLGEFLVGEHRRIEALLRAAMRPGGVDEQAWARFQEALQRHVEMEERILLPAVRRTQGGMPLSIAATLHGQHRQLDRLLGLQPTSALLHELHALLAEHNRVEEDEGSFHDVCDRLLGGDAEAILTRLREQRSKA
jgi:hypothetical protein